MPFSDLAKINSVGDLLNILIRIYSPEVNQERDVVTLDKTEI